MRLNFKQFGKDYRPLVILHGLMGSLDNWQSLARRWSENFPVYIVDQRNHGRSPHSEVFTYEAMVEDVLEFILEHDLRDINLLGHSMGGKTAMLFALKYPQYVGKLIVADIGPVSYTGGLEYIFDAMRALPLEEITSRQDAEEHMLRFIASPAISKFVLKNLKRNPDGPGYVWKINLDKVMEGYPEILKFDSEGRVFDKPTLFIKGENSDYINPDDFEAYKKIFPHAALKTIEGTGHWLHAEHPDLVYISVKVFAQLKQK
jgi:pimeloyl-ACP methyl ester carboxylesterase